MELKSADACLCLRGSDTFLTLSSLKVGTSTIPAGRYRASDFRWLEGEGVLLVGEAIPGEPAEETTATWTGAGADDLLSTAANWADGVLPDLTTGSLVATFPPGATPVVPADDTIYRFRGIVAENALTLTKTAGAFPLLLGSSGLTTAGALTLTADVVMTEAQTWSLGAASEITAGGHVACLTPSKAWTISCPRLTILSTNERLPNAVNVAQGGKIRLAADNAIGSSTTTVKGPGGTADFLIFSGSHAYDCGFNNQGSAGGDGPTAVTFFTVESGDIVLNGLVQNAGVPNIVWWHFATSAGKASVTFNGGCTYGGSNINSAFSGLHKGTITYAKKPFDVTRMFVGYNQNYVQTLNLNVASNRTTRGLHLIYNSTLNTTVKDALYATGTGSSGVTLTYGTTWNLSADQGVNILNGRSPSARVTSATGATLLLRDDRLNTVKTSETFKTLNGYTSTLLGEIVKTNHVSFAGNVNFVKAGALDHFLLGTSTSTGTLTVTNGRLEFLEGGSWATASAVSVSGTGILAAKNGVFGKETAISVDTTDGAAIEIPAGQKVRCGSLTVNGTPVNDGVYSGTGVTGGGSLLVGQQGILIIVK